MDPNQILHGFEKNNLCSLLEFTFSLEQCSCPLKQKCGNLEFTFPSECEKLKFTVAYPLRKDRLSQHYLNPRKSN